MQQALDLFTTLRCTHPAIVPGRSARCQMRETGRIRPDRMTANRACGAVIAGSRSRPRSGRSPAGFSASNQGRPHLPRERGRRSCGHPHAVGSDDSPAPAQPRIPPASRPR
jgi:hypothetical protein